MLALQGPSECDRILDRELRARTHREMCGVRRIAHEDDVLMRPGGVSHGDEVPPQRAILEEAVTPQLFGKEPLAELDGVVLTRPIEAGAAPRRFRGLDDKGRVSLFILIRMHAP